MFANRYTALIDACVLVSAPKRDLILTLARAEMYRFRWTDQIMSETETALATIFTERTGSSTDSQARAKRSCEQMLAAFPEAMIEGDFVAVPSYLGITDANDNHIVHAAVQCKASIIVTDNLRDFPNHALEPYEMEAKSADDFIADAIDLDRVRAAEAVKQLRSRLKNPPLSAEEMLDRWEKGHGLIQTVSLLRDFQGLI